MENQIVEEALIKSNTTSDIGFRLAFGNGKWTSNLPRRQLPVESGFIS